MENEVRLIDVNTLWQCDTCGAKMRGEADD